MAPVDPGVAPTAPPAEAPVINTPPPSAAEAAQPLSAPPPAALSSPAPIPTAAAAAAAPPAAAAVAPLPVGALLAGGSQYAYEDLGITLTVPAGWTQQLMTGGVIAMFSEDYPAKGKRERGALMLISPHKGTLPTDDKQLTQVLKDGLDPAATLEAGPIRLPVADKQAAQIVVRASDADGVNYRALHTIMQRGGKAVSVKSSAFDDLTRRKPVFDAVMESITFSGAGA
ncbi:hypothetical protein [uncultured Lamprocystis sp.]|jgi:hypothetical protein|uniref:hypothetical protein n=1 Tax=uncultured Lamprocystis sp. TaxID=543132 RepID=UPI0025DB9155|nr:hypothetical protein [uncultured Lamprocystis sp.]